jgi:Glutamine cyclotransferase
VREVDLATGNVTRSKSIPDTDFGEGLARIRDRLYQLTWMSGKGFSYAVDNFTDVTQIKASIYIGLVNNYLVSLLWALVCIIHSLFSLYDYYLLLNCLFHL